MIDELPHDEVPRFLIGAVPIAKSSRLAIGLGPICVFRSLLVLRFEATRIPTSDAARFPTTGSTPRRQTPIYLNPALHPAPHDIPHMDLRCSVTDVGRASTPVDVTQIPVMSRTPPGRAWAYFGIADLPENGTLSIQWSFEEYDIATTSYDVNLRTIAHLRNQVQSAFTGGVQ